MNSPTEVLALVSTVGAPLLTSANVDLTGLFEKKFRFRTIFNYHYITA